MEDLYSYLACSPTATAEELRKSYCSLALLNHPDKSGGDHSKFVNVSLAWRILGNCGLRSEYDKKWAERKLTLDYPVQDEVDFDDFEAVPLNIDTDVSFNSSPAKGELVSQEVMNGDLVHGYSLSCRCSGEYFLSPTDVLFKFDFAGCSSCSLCVRVVYADCDSANDSANELGHG